MQFSGVLFDLDGVLVDTLHYHYLAWKKMFDFLGGEVSELTVLLHEGRNSFEILPLLLEEAQVELPQNKWETFIEKKRAYYRSIATINYYPHAIETIKTLVEKNIHCALVTACARKNMEKAVPPQLRKYFDVIITGQDVRQAKPHADPYATAQKKLAIPKEQCLVVENAPLGIQSAQAAGITCAAVATTLPREYLHEADIQIEKVSDILPIIIH